MHNFLDRGIDDKNATEQYDDAVQVELCLDDVNQRYRKHSGRNHG